jgi:uncharacterized protein involved in outer membrane biogenesis
MKRALKMMLALVVVAVGAMAAFLLTFDVNRYKPGLDAFLERQTGRRFEIAGDIRFVPSLRPTLAVEGVALGNAPWAQDADFLRVERAEAQVALGALLERRIAVKRIELHGVTLDLQTNETGEGNWLLTHGQRAGKPLVATVLSALAIDALSIKDSVVRYRRAGVATVHELAIERVTATATAPQSPVGIDFKGRYRAVPVTATGTIAAWTALAGGGPVPIDVSGVIGEAGFRIKGDVPRGQDTQGLTLALQAADLAAFGRLLGATWPPLSPATLTATLSKQGGRYLLDAIEAKAGRSALTGKLAVAMTEAGPDLSGAIHAPRIDLTEVVPPPRDRGGRVLPSTPMFIDRLPPGTAKLTLDAATVSLRKMELADVAATLTVADGMLQVAPLRAAAAGGTVDGRVTIAPAAGKAPAVQLDLRGAGILPARLPQFEGKRIAGAPVDFTVDIAGHGRSIAEVMGGGNGRLLVRTGPGTIPSNLGSADLLFDSLRLLNPLSGRAGHTNLECAVFNFGVRDGLASAREGVAVRTDQLTVLGGGLVNLRTEAIDIGVKPKPRSGSGLNVASLGGDLVRIGGTLSDPKPVANAEAVAGVGLKVGAAMATGGLSLVAEGLFDRATADEDVCTIALRGGSAASTSTAAPEKSAIGKAADGTRKAVRKTGEAVQGALKKLFGR